MENCNNIKIDEVTLTRSAFWTVHLLGCVDVLVNKVNIINNLKLTNCDGIDPDRSKNVKITNCNISCADDCVVLKATSGSAKYGNTENVSVKDCNFVSTSAAIKIGTETCGDFNNISFENINIDSTNRGISLMLRDNGNISNCSFKNIKMKLRLFSKIHWWGSDEGIAITAIPRKDVVGNISNLVFENIDIESENGILIFGHNNNISNITLNNINLNIIKKTEYEHKYLDLRPSIYDIIDRPFYGLTIENASDITFNNFNIKNNTDYIKELYNISNSKNINL